MERQPSLGAWLVALGITNGLVGCAPPTALVALPSSRSRWIDDFAASATEGRVTVEAHMRGSAGPAGGGAPLAGRTTPVFVRIDNGGAVPLRISRDTFELITGTARFRALAPERVGVEELAAELSATTLAPGATASGVVHFEPVIGGWGFVHLRTMLVDAGTEQLLDTIDVPFASGTRVSCTLTSAEQAEPSREAWLFRTCLP